MKYRRIYHSMHSTRWVSLLLTYVVICSLALSNTVFAVAQGDAQIIYGLGTTQTPYARNYTSGSWGAASALPSTGGTIYGNITQASPTRNELMSGVVLSNGTLVVYRYDGTSWTEQWRVTGGSPLAGPRFDIAYEQVSGRAMVMYSTNNSGGASLAYRLWNGTSWTSASNYFSTNAGDVALRVRLVARSGTNEIAAGWVDNGPYLSADYWDGATSTWKGEPSDPLDTKVAFTGTYKAGSKMFDMAFESVSGRLMIMWGDDNDAYPFYILRSAGPSGTWGTKTAGTSGYTSTNGFAAQGMDMQLASEPGTNYIAYVDVADYVSSSCSANQCASAAIWNGSSWGYFNAFDSSTSQLQPALVRASVKWIQSSGQSRAVIVYDDNNEAGVDWIYFNKNTLTWSSILDYTGAPAPPSGDMLAAAAAGMWLYNNPFNSAELLYLTATWNTSTGVSGLYTKKLLLSGSTLTWSSIESSALNASSLSERNGWVAGLVYYQFVPPVGALGVDIVNAAGASISSPLVAFPAKSSGTTCQTTSTTLGTSSQKIRTSNTTSNASWTVTIAPTAGSTAMWASGSNRYDMNDTTGSGCTDGADSDAYGGRLSFNPAAGTVSPQSGCSSTGITKGSSTGFTQGTTDTITLLSASSSAATNCYWDLTGISAQQSIPSFQASGAYSLPMTITVTAL